MKFAIFGLAVSSSWGNGHATLWRGLLRNLHERGHAVVFFERDVPYYAENRDLTELPGGELALYSDWNTILPVVQRHLSDADVAIVTSYCPDAIPATARILDSRASLKVFYDLDTGVTLEHVRRGEPVAYIGPRGLRDFDLVLSYTGGAALDQLRTGLGARRTAALYGSVDPTTHFPATPDERYRAELSYLGTYAQDRQVMLDRLFVQAARRLPERHFVIGGTLYPDDLTWSPNIRFAHHLPPPEHPAFYSSSRLTLNITRRAMAKVGYCPSARLFEAAACAVPLVSDWWEGLDIFFAPGSEIIVAKTTDDVIEALTMPDQQLAALARRAGERTLAEHTAEHRAIELERILQDALYVKSMPGHAEAPEFYKEESLPTA